MTAREGMAHGYRWLGVAAVCVVLDQLTKWYVTATLAYGERIDVLPVFSWVLWHNDGAAFSLLSGSGGWQRWFFLVLALAFTIFILVELRRLTPADWLMGLVYGLILGGALGNAIDRLQYGYVIDFILVHYGDWYFPAFNVADMCLSCGAMLWILVLIGSIVRDRRGQAAGGTE
ncbi:MAG TPA: signal peptidase II [Pseudomonadales bacterium]